MSPLLDSREYIFCTVEGDVSNYLHLNPICSFVEDEGLTLILPLDAAITAQIPYESIFRKITLSVHSSLDAVGLTAAVAEKLASVNISANVVAAYYHDHVFVPKDKAGAALRALQQFQSDT